MSILIVVKLSIVKLVNRFPSNCFKSKVILLSPVNESIKINLSFETLFKVISIDLFQFPKYTLLFIGFISTN